MMETIITIEYPFKRIPKIKRDQFYHFLPWRCRWLGWLIDWGGGSVTEFGGARVNTVRHYQLFRWHVLTIRRNQYHDKSDRERADEYLRKLSECEKELRGLRLITMGDSMNHEVKQLIRESLGIDMDEGRVL